MELTKKKGFSHQQIYNGNYRALLQ